MKIVLRILAVLVILAIGALVLFLATFDAERYRPLLVAKLEEALGQPVEVEGVSLGWHRGIALNLEGLKIGKSAVEAHSIQGVLSLGPLLHRQFQVAGIRISGLRLHLVRNPQGRVEISGLTPPAQAGPESAGVASKALPLIVERIEVQDGTLVLTDLSATPPLDVTLQNLKLLARMERNRLELKTLTGQVGEGTFSVRGTVSEFLKEPDVQVLFRTERLALDSILPSPPPDQPQLRGKLFTTLQFRWIENRLLGEGTVRLEEARLENLNVLREVFDRLAILPGLTETLLSRLPDSYRERFFEKDTLLEPVEFRVIAKGEEVSWEGLRIASESFEIRGSGQANLKGAFLFPAEIRLDPALSGAIIRSVEELRFLTDEQGKLTMPVLLQGTLPNVSILPDVNYVAQRLIASKGEELLGRLLEKVLER